MTDSPDMAEELLGPPHARSAEESDKHSSRARIPNLTLPFCFRPMAGSTGER
jgi:hypothetical protein